MKCNKLFFSIFLILVGFIAGYLFSIFPRIKNEPVETIFDKIFDSKLTKQSEVNFKIAQIQNDEKYLSQVLYNEIKLLCWVMHNVESLEKRMAVMETWGRRCNMLLFVVGNITVPSVNHPLVTTLAPNVKLVQLKMDDSYDLLWLKTKLAFSFIVKKYGSEFEWIYKVDDDSFVVIENLKLFLKYKNPQEKVYYGCQLQLEKTIYCSGGPGYVMSNHTARQFVNSLKLPDCPQDDYGSEDVNVAVCLALLGIHPSDTRDDQNRFRFVPFPPQEAVDEYLLTSVNAWFYKDYSVQKMQHDVDCCSDSAIAYHYVPPSMMKTLEYLVYYLHPFTNRDVWIPRE